MAISNDYVITATDVNTELNTLKEALGQATSSKTGTMKLYTSLGQDTDGAPTNKAVQDAVNGKANSSHTHDDRYYTESEVDTKLNTKQSKDRNAASPSTSINSYDFTYQSGGTINHFYTSKISGSYATVDSQLNILMSYAHTHSIGTSACSSYCACNVDCSCNCDDDCCKRE